MEKGGTFQLRRRWPRTPGPCRLPARGSKCSGHLAAVKGCPFGRNSRPESAGPGRDVRPLPQLPLQRVETSLEQPLLGHPARERPPDTRAPAACGHVQTAFPAVRVPGSGSQDPRQSSVRSRRSWGTARGVQGAPWRVSQATRQKQSKANHPLPRNGNGSLFNHVVNVCLKHREALIIL